MLSRRLKTFIALGTLLTILVIYLIFWPVPIEPVAWTPPPAPKLEGSYTVNDALAKAERLGENEGIGPEDVTIDA